MDAKALLSKHAEDVFGVLFPFDKQHEGMNVLVINLGKLLDGERLPSSTGCPVMHKSLCLLLRPAPGDLAERMQQPFREHNITPLQAVAPNVLF